MNTTETENLDVGEELATVRRAIGHFYKLLLETPPGDEIPLLDQRDMLTQLGDAVERLTTVVEKLHATPEGVLKERAEMAVALAIANAAKRLRGRS